MLSPKPAPLPIQSESARNFNLELLSQQLCASAQQQQAHALAALAAIAAGPQQHAAALVASGVVAHLGQVLRSHGCGADVALFAAKVMRDIVRWLQPAHVDHVMQCGGAQHLVNFLAGNDSICEVALAAMESILAAAKCKPEPSAIVRRQAMKLYPEGWSASSTSHIPLAASSCSPANADARQHAAQLIACAAPAALRRTLERASPASPIAQSARRILDHFAALVADVDPVVNYMNNVIGRSVVWPTATTAMTASASASTNSGPYKSALGVSEARTQMMAMVKYVALVQALSRQLLALAHSPTRFSLPFHELPGHMTIRPEVTECLLVRVRRIEPIILASRLAAAAAGVALAARVRQRFAQTILERVLWSHCRNVQAAAAAVMKSKPDLFAAARHGDVALVNDHVFVDPGSVMRRDHVYQRTPLIYATAGNHILASQSLIAAKADVNAKDDDDNTPLIWAAVRGNVELCKVLIASKADVDARDDSGKTALFWAVSDGNMELCTTLVAAGASADAANSRESTPLMHSARSGNLEMCRLLVSHKADVNTRSNIRDTPLMTAAHHGHLDVCKLLVTSLADVQATNSDGLTALIHALNFNHSGVAAYLSSLDSLPPNADGTPCCSADGAVQKKILREILNEQSNCHLR